MVDLLGGRRLRMVCHISSISDGYRTDIHVYSSRRAECEACQGRVRPACLCLHLFVHACILILLIFLAASLVLPNVFLLLYTFLFVHTCIHPLSAYDDALSSWLLLRCGPVNVAAVKAALVDYERHHEGNNGRCRVRRRR